MGRKFELPRGNGGREASSETGRIGGESLAFGLILKGQRRGPLGAGVWWTHGGRRRIFGFSG